MKLNIKNPYLGKGKFLWKHNDDSKLGKACEDCNKKITKKNSMEESRDLKMCNKCFNKMCDENEEMSSHS